MRIKLFILLLLLVLQAKAQNLETYVKFNSPAIVGPTSFGGKIGVFQLNNFSYDLASNQGKVLPGSLKLTVFESNLMPQIWSLMLTSEPIDIEIYQFKTFLNNPVVYRTFKVNNSFINAIKYKTDDQMASSQEIDIWLGRFAFEYKVLNASGATLSTHTTGWDFINNVTFNF